MDTKNLDEITDKVKQLNAQVCLLESNLNRIGLTMDDVFKKEETEQGNL